MEKVKRRSKNRTALPDKEIPLPLIRQRCFHRSAKALNPVLDLGSIVEQIETQSGSGFRLNRVLD